MIQRLLYILIAYQDLLLTVFEHHYTLLILLVVQIRLQLFSSLNSSFIARRQNLRDQVDLRQHRHSIHYILNLTLLNGDATLKALPQ